MKQIIFIFCLVFTENALYAQATNIAYTNNANKNAKITFGESPNNSSTINLEMALRQQATNLVTRLGKTTKRSSDDIEGGMSIGVYGLLGLPIDPQGALFKGENGTTFDRFVASYNKLNSATITTPLTKLNPTFYGAGGAYFYYNFFYAEIGYAGFAAETSASFKNGSKREIKYEQHGVNTGIGLGFGTGNIAVYAYGGLDFGFGDRLTAYMIYPDGTKSYGNENLLNGVYVGTARFGLIYGLRAFFGGKNVKFMLAATKMSEWTERSKLGVSDHERGTAGVMTPGDLTDNRIGTNWGEYIKNPTQYGINKGEMVLSGWNGLSLNIGVAFGISSAED
jgi:hypothetical protein